MENTDIFTLTEKEYKSIDKCLKASRELFAALKALEASGAYGTAEWADLFAKYCTVFKKANGYKPHWAR